MAELRSFIFIDQLQPQTLAYLATWIRGSLPRARMAAQIIEISPGLGIEALTDVALKAGMVGAGVLVVERQYGTLEFHSRATAEVHAAADAVLAALGAAASDATPPKILASKIVTRVDRQHAFLMNRNRLGSMVLTDESLYLFPLRLMRRRKEPSGENCRISAASRSRTATVPSSSNSTPATSAKSISGGPSMSPMVRMYSAG